MRARKPKWQEQVHWRYLAAGVVAAIVVYGVSWVLYPEWRASWGTALALLAVVVGGVTACFDAFKSAFVKEDEPPAGAGTQIETHTQVQTHTQTQSGDGVQVGDIKNVNDSTVIVAGGNVGMDESTARDVLSLPARETMRRQYLERVFAQARQLALGGIDRQSAGERDTALDLHAVYTALLTLSSAEEPEAREARTVMREPEHLRRASAVVQADKHARLVLLGEPGSGKSTFANFLTLCLAGELLKDEGANLALLCAPLPEDKPDKEKEPEPQTWRHGALLPVPVILRDFAARGLPPAGKPANAQSVRDFITHELEAAALGEYAPELFKELGERGGLLLLDGLDEVSDAEHRREQMRAAIEDFAKTYQKCRIVVTSRTYAYQKQEWRLRGFAEAVLAPFERAQVARFVERWYAHIGARRGWSAADTQGRAALLQGAIERSERLQELAARPLLLTLMASLHAWRGGTLPDRREELYADAVELLLDWWQQPKVVRDAQGKLVVPEPSLSEWLAVDKQRVRAVLNEQAYRAHAGQADLRGTADIAEDALVWQLLHVTPNPNIKPMQLIAYLRDRAGLIVPRGVGVYTFPHRTFQEYLAACWLTEDYPDQVAQLARAAPERWREVALLAAGKAARGAASTVWALVDALCWRAPGDADVVAEDAWGALLAGQVLVESADLTRVSPANAQKLVRVRRWLETLVAGEQLAAVERVRAGVVLGKLGDERAGVCDVDTMPLCYVPAGRYRMEESEESVPVGAFGIGRYVVTNAQYAEFVREGGYARQEWWVEAERDKFWKSGKVKDSEGWYAEPWDFGEPFTLPNHPVVGVSWYEGVAFTRWLGERWRGRLPVGAEVRLAHEVEWELAARRGELVPERACVFVAGEAPVTGNLVPNADVKRVYPWGDKIGVEYANYDETGIGATSAVGCFARGESPYGVLDMAGNVWEWVLGEQEDSKGSRGVRGSAFRDLEWFARRGVRSWFSPYHRTEDVGLRVVVAFPA